jgi:surface antigen
MNDRRRIPVAAPAGLLPWLAMLMLAALAGCAEVRSNMDKMGEAVDTAFGSVSGKMRDSTGRIEFDAVYSKLTPGDAKIAQEVLQTTLESKPDGEEGKWRNKRTGNSGHVKIDSTYVSREGFFCRNYDEAVTIGEESATVRNTACRNAAGVWVFVI